MENRKSNIIVLIALSLILIVGTLGCASQQPVAQTADTAPSTVESSAQADTPSTVESSAQADTTPATVESSAQADTTPPTVESSAQTTKLNPQQERMATILAGARHFYGEPDAPVTIVEFSDFNCAYCAKWTKETRPLIKENYIDKGKVRMAYMHYPALGKSSVLAAAATECAARQNKDSFWDMHDTLFANQKDGFTYKTLNQMAEQIGLDTASFSDCLTNFDGMALIENDVRLSQLIGMRGTPTFVINGIVLAGALPFSEFQKTIDKLLAGEQF